MRAALYARFSTDQQSEQSIADQLRVCRRLAERQGFHVAREFSDAAISGGTTSRPGYQDLLTAARRGEFDAIVAEDSSRLWRNMAEQAPRIAELRDLGLHIVTHDLDTRQESSVMLGAVLGAMGEGYRAEIGRRVRRGLEGLARAQKPTGGRAYGYIAAADSPLKRREVHAEQAAVVRWIFERYADGWSPRRIADDLNRRAIPSPGSSWNRGERRKRGWLASAIHGDPARSAGMLNNDLYRGRVVWNRARWIRSAVDSKKRRKVVNPRSEWVEYTDERLRIVSDELWQRVKARQADRQHQVGERVKAGLNAATAGRTGRAGGYLFSGLLVCADCGSRYVISDRRHYACASRLNGGAHACASNARLVRVEIEAGLLEGIKARLRQPAARDRVIRGARQLLRDQERQAPDHAKRIGQLEAQIANLAEAIAGGALHSSRALGTRLQAAEAELAQLQAEATRPTGPTVDRLLPGLVDQFEDLVENLEHRLAPEEVPALRLELGRYIGPIRVRATPTEVVLEVSRNYGEISLLRAAGFENLGQQISVVAGAGFEPATFGL